MIARIHHLKHGTEYVLQYTCKTDTIELRILKHTLLGRSPNYFRHKRGTYVREMSLFQETLRNRRSSIGINRIPQLTDIEEATIHEFEEIANINLMLTPYSVSRSWASAMGSFALSLQGLDLQPLISATSRLAENLVQEFAVTSHLVWFSSRYADGSDVTEQDTESDTEQEQNPPTEAEVENIRQRLQPDEELRVARYEAAHIVDLGSPPIPQEAPTLRNTEGLTEAQIQENQEFITRLLNGETISARENPPLPNPNSEDASVPDDNTETETVSLAQLPGLDTTSRHSYQDMFDRLLRAPHPENDVDTSTPDPNTAEIDDFLKEIDETLSDTTRDSDEVWGAPTHSPLLNADTMSKLWKQAQKATSITPQNGAAPNQGSDDAG